MNVEFEDTTGKPRPKHDIEAALRFVVAEMIANPIRMGASNTGPAVMHLLVIKDVLSALLRGMS